MIARRYSIQLEITIHVVDVEKVVIHQIEHQEESSVLDGTNFASFVTKEDIFRMFAKHPWRNILMNLRLSKKQTKLI